MISIKTITNEAVISNPAWITSVILIASSAASTVTLNDSADASGTDRISVKVVANESKQFYFGDKGVRFDAAVYSTITGTDAVAYVYYK